MNFKGITTAQRPGAPRMHLRCSTGLSPFLSRFAHDENGNLSIGAMAVYVGAALVCGIGVDLMMNEMNRTNLQHTLDRAILAAADLDQELAPQSVVEDYFATSGLTDALTSVTVEQGLNFRTVSAEATTYSEPLFSKALGVNRLVAPAAGTAEERVANVEISMVLDISGSMGWTSADGSITKIEMLRNAANKFVDTVIKQDAGGLTTVSIVPYNATVNLGSTLSQYFTLSAEHDYSDCAVFPTSSFTELGISRSIELDKLSHFDPYTWTTSPSDTIDQPWCPVTDYGAILVHSDSKTELKSTINALGAGGNTAIDLGMKWGLALLDPGAQPLISDMIADGHITPDASARPAAYDDREAMKIVVLMTDGENTTQYDLKAINANGNSWVYVDERGTADRSDDRYSVRVREDDGSGKPRFYWPRYSSYSWDYRYRSYADGGSNARRLSNAEVFDRFATSAVWEYLYERPYNDGWVGWGDVSHFRYPYESIVDADEADSRLATICNEARDTGVTVYSIGFEAPDRGIAAMKQCASSPSHFFDVQGVEIEDAFQAIARTINQLRLTQ